MSHNHSVQFYIFYMIDLYLEYFEKILKSINFYPPVPVEMVIKNTRIKSNLLTQ